MRKITIIIDFEIYFYLFKPLIEEFQRKKITLYIVCPVKIKEKINNDLGSKENLIFIDLGLIKKKTFLLKFLHRLLSILFTKHSFSIQYARGVKLYSGKKGLIKYLYKLSYFMPKVDNPNYFLSQIVGVFSRNLFPTKKIMIGSLNASPELLCYKKNEIITVMESWDHCVKHPNGYISDLVIIWNEDLKNDWIKHQMDKNVISSFPLKLRYANDIIFNNKKNMTFNSKIKKCIYAVASAKNFSVPSLTRVEHKIIKKICKATQEAGWDLMIKPRPVGDTNEFDYFLDKYSHVSIGFTSEPKEFAANYFLGDEYNKIRFKEISKAQLVINCFTTFGLDSAVSGKPVLQMDVSRDFELEESKKFYANHHIKNYLIKSKNILKIKQGESLDTVLSNYLKSDKNLHIKYSEELRNWLIRDQKDSRIPVKENIKKVMNGKY